MKAHKTERNANSFYSARSQHTSAGIALGLSREQDCLPLKLIPLPSRTAMIAATGPRVVQASGAMAAAWALSRYRPGPGRVVEGSGVRDVWGAECRGNAMCDASCPFRVTMPALGRRAAVVRG